MTYEQNLNSKREILSFLFEVVRLLSLGKVGLANALF